MTTIEGRDFSTPGKYAIYQVEEDISQMDKGVPWRVMLVAIEQCEKTDGVHELQGSIISGIGRQLEVVFDSMHRIQPEKKSEAGALVLEAAYTLGEYPNALAKKLNEGKIVIFTRTQALSST